MNKENTSLDIKLFLLDMDGTIYLEYKLFDGVLEFLDLLTSKNIKYIFVTNNSSKSQEDYLEMLKGLNIKVTDENIFSSSMATGMYLREYYKDKRVYLVGTKAMENELLQYGVNLVEENAEVVVVGFDRELTYKKLEKACYFLDHGATFIAANADWVYPIAGKRYIPDCGSICQMITIATGKKPIFIGKPSPEMINILAKKYDIAKENIAMVGDRMYTDIASGVNANVKTILVLSGESTMKTVEESDFKPDLILDSITDIPKYLK